MRLRWCGCASRTRSTVSRVAEGPSSCCCVRLGIALNDENNDNNENENNDNNNNNNENDENNKTNRIRSSSCVRGGRERFVPSAVHERTTMHRKASHATLGGHSSGTTCRGKLRMLLGLLGAATNYHNFGNPRYPSISTNLRYQSSTPNLYHSIVRHYHI